MPPTRRNLALGLLLLSCLGGPAVADREDIEQMLAARRLSTRDKNLGRAVAQPQDVHEDTLRMELKPHNFIALERAIQQAPTPEIRALLIEEHNKLRGLAQRITGQPVVMPPKRQPLFFPYDPQPEHYDLRMPPRG